MSNYIVKDSGKRKKYKSGFQRDPAEGKPRFDLIIPNNQKYEDTMLYRLAMLYSNGARKYEPRNWEKAHTKEEINRFKESAFRHFIQWYTNEKDGEDHASAIIFNIVGVEYVSRLSNRAS